MRLGGYPCRLLKGTKARDAYKSDEVSERHRHRFEFNNAYREKFEDHGLIFSGRSPDDQLVEILELKSHPWFVACQFHPELKSRPMEAHPLFNQLVRMSMRERKDS